MKLSIIIPCYNIENYIGDCIKSCLEQNLTNNDYEIIVINDGSTDHTGKIIDSFNDDKLKVLHIENHGVSNARNFGLSFAKGDYIWFVDGDDLIQNNILNKLYTTAILEKMDMLFFNYVSFTDSKEVKFMTSDLNEKASIFTNRQDIRNIRSFSDKSTGNYVHSVIFRKSFILKNDLLFNTKMAYQEDTLFLFYAKEYAKTVGKLNSNIYYYRTVSTSAMNLKNKEKSLKYINTLLEMRKDLISNKNKFTQDVKLDIDRRVNHICESILFLLIFEVNISKEKEKEILKLVLPYKIRFYEIKQVFKNRYSLSLKQKLIVLIKIPLGNKFYFNAVRFLVKNLNRI